MTTLEIDQRIESLLDASRELFREHPARIRAAILYGSALEPGFRMDSDIDIAVLDDEVDRLSWREQAVLMGLLERTLKRGVDLRMLRDGSPSYQMHVLEHGRVIWESPEGATSRYGRAVLPALRSSHQRSLLEWPRVLSRLAGH